MKSNHEKYPIENHERKYSALAAVQSTSFSAGLIKKRLRANGYNPEVKLRRIKGTEA